MKERKNRRFSLCGLNCGLCPMLLDGRCGGCGNGSQSCKVTRCGLERGVEYCYECSRYPCELYEHIDDYDSFITHQRQKADLEKAKRIGIDAYNLEQEEKAHILRELLKSCNDGRRKTFFCAAVNLLELSDIQPVVREIACNPELTALPVKERCLYVVNAFQRIAGEKTILCKLRKKKR